MSRRILIFITRFNWHSSNMGNEQTRDGERRRIRFGLTPEHLFAVKEHFSTWILFPTDFKMT